MTSMPAYDPNEFTTGIDPMLWTMLANDPGTPLMNRVIQGQYAPGSTFKIIMATAALEERVISPSTTFYCPGYLRIYDRVRHCNVPGGHGIVDVPLRVGDVILVQGPPDKVESLRGQPGFLLLVGEANAERAFAVVLDLEVPGDYAIPWHTHTSAERMVLVSGTLRVTYTGQDPAVVNTGSYAYGPGERPHEAYCLPGPECVLFIAFEEPVDAFPFSAP